ncbi:hypothetical protein BDW67DRAFT_50253 [Aspergillus spinulosporus]
MKHPEKALSNIDPPSNNRPTVSELQLEPSKKRNRGLCGCRFAVCALFSACCVLMACGCGWLTDWPFRMINVGHSCGSLQPGTFSVFHSAFSELLVLFVCFLIFFFWPGTKLVLSISVLCSSDSLKADFGPEIDDVAG